MIDPITAVGLATSAFNILKQGLSREGHPRNVGQL